MAGAVKKSHTVLKAVLICVIALLAAGALVFVILQVQYLNEEAQAISSLENYSEEIPEDIRTNGSFAVVEETMEDYCREYREALVRVYTALEDERFVNLLDTENIQADGPDFRESKAYLEEKREEIRRDAESLSGLRQESSIMARIEEKNLWKPFNKLYRRLMMEQVRENYMVTNHELEIAYTDMSGAISARYDALEFLFEQQAGWSLEDGKLLFRDEKLLRQYQSLISEL